tara:strand:- start:921 stop:1088 length:168 start_codon:yes stop_codon:yes gene_type:complete
MKSPIRVTEILKPIGSRLQKVQKNVTTGGIEKKKVNSDKVPEHLDFSSDDRGLFI